MAEIEGEPADVHAASCAVWSSHDPYSCGGQEIADGIDALMALFDAHGPKRLVDENGAAS